MVGLRGLPRDFNLLPLNALFQVSRNYSITLFQLPQLCLFFLISVPLKSQSVLQIKGLLQSQRDESELPLPGFCDAVTRRNLTIKFYKPTVHVGSNMEGSENS